MTFLAGQKLTAAMMEKIANPPRCRVLGTVAQPIPHNAFTAISFPQEEYKANIGHDTVTNPTFFSAQVAGLYRLNGACFFDTNGTGLRALKWQKNGVDVPGSGTNMASYTPGQPGLNARTIEVELAVADFVMLMAYQNSGVSVPTYVATDYARPSMSICLIRDNSL